MVKKKECLTRQQIWHVNLWVEELTDASKWYITNLTSPDTQCQTLNKDICRKFHNFEKLFNREPEPNSVHFDAYLANSPCLEATKAAGCEDWLSTWGHLLPHLAKRLNGMTAHYLPFTLLTADWLHSPQGWKFPSLYIFWTPTHTSCLLLTLRHSCPTCFEIHKLTSLSKVNM